MYTNVPVIKFIFIDKYWFIDFSSMEASLTFYLYNGSRISLVVTVPDWRVGGRGFDSRDQTNTLGLKVTEQWRYWLCPENGSPVEGVKNSVPTSTFVLIHWLSNKVQFLFQVFLSFIIFRFPLILPVFLRNKKSRILFCLMEILCFLLWYYHITFIELQWLASERSMKNWEEW